MIKLLLVHQASIDLEIKDRFDNQSKILKSKKKAYIINKNHL